MDRCALFVDAGYVLADGAMAVHGTRRGGSVSWDYEGLLQLLSGLARERTGVPVLRCYWYEATVDGRRTAEHGALADVPGIKLRVAKIRPGRREGVESEIHRDLTTLARNNAISDALVVSAEEDLAQVVADVQDLGMRVTLIHITVDGNWTISRALRQESDDIIEISDDHLRPYVELIAGAEPARADDLDDGRAAARPLANGHSTAPAASYQVPAPTGKNAPPAIYTSPVVAEYQRPAVQLPREAREARDSRDDRVREDRAREEMAREERAREEEERAREERAREERAREERAREEREQRAREERAREERAREERAREDRAREERAREERAREDRAVTTVNGEAHAPARPEIPGQSDIYIAPAASARSRPDRQEPAVQNPAARARVGEDVPGYSPGPLGTPEPAPQPPTAQLRRLPSSRNPAGQDPLGPSGATPMPGSHGGQGTARSAPFSGPQPVLPSEPPGYLAGGVSLSDAVQAAYEEGQEFGGSVARDAPALWLEAVLARKPRMPSDLEARLLQGSALPIDFLLHDEVRHALRRGFWDALERTRR